MENDKRTKLLIAVLALAGVGAGSYYFFLRGDTNAAPLVVGEGGGRKERKVSTDTKKDTRKEREKKAEAPAEPEGRKEREARPTTDASGRKKRDGKNNEAVKKKKIVPAA